MSCTTASRRPSSRLTSVDLPTFGRPTTASTGAGGTASTSSPATSGASGDEVVGVEPERGHRRAVVAFRHVLLRTSSSSRTSRPARSARVSVAAASPARPAPAGMVSGSPTTTSTRGRNRRPDPSGRRVPRHDDRQHRGSAGAGQPRRPVLGRGDLAAATCALGEHADHAAAAQHVQRGRQRPPVGRAAAHRESARSAAAPHPATPLNISCLTRNTARRPSSPKSSGPSTNALWLATTTTAPRAGIRSRWWTCTR